MYNIVLMQVHAEEPQTQAKEQTQQTQSGHQVKLNFDAVK